MRYGAALPRSPVTQAEIIVDAYSPCENAVIPIIKLAGAASERIAQRIKSLG